jgi:hypothetical protein
LVFLFDEKFKCVPHSHTLEELPFNGKWISYHQINVNISVGERANEKEAAYRPFTQLFIRILTTGVVAEECKVIFSLLVPDVEEEGKTFSREKKMLKNIFLISSGVQCVCANNFTAAPAAEANLREVPS